jgi:hypothetical protein
MYEYYKYTIVLERLFLPTARSAVGLGITGITGIIGITGITGIIGITWNHSFYLAIWPFYHFDILTFQDRG